MEEDNISGISDSVLKINAPSAKIEIIGNGRKRKYRVEISIGAAPSPGPEWLNERFKSAEETIYGVIGCYFGNRIDFYNESLERWFGEEA